MDEELNISIFQNWYIQLLTYFACSRHIFLSVCNYLFKPHPFWKLCCGYLLFHHKFYYLDSISIWLEMHLDHCKCTQCTILAHVQLYKIVLCWSTLYEIRKNQVLVPDSHPNVRKAKYTSRFLWPANAIWRSCEGTLSSILQLRHWGVAPTGAVAVRPPRYSNLQ